MVEIEMNKESIQKVLDKVIETLIKKNDYGGASFDLGLNGNMVHIWDKAHRFRTLIEKRLRKPVNIMENNKPNFESVLDTLEDIIGYGVIGIHILNSENEQKVLNDGKEINSSQR